MPSTTQIALGLIGIAVGLLGAAMKLGGFTNASIAWLMIAIAVAIFLVAVGLWIQPYYRRILWRSPVRLLPASIVQTTVPTSTKLMLEFEYVKNAYLDIENAVHMLRMVIEQQSAVENREDFADPLPIRVTLPLKSNSSSPAKPCGLLLRNFMRYIEADYLFSHSP
jgi:hypothetical protein